VGLLSILMAMVGRGDPGADAGESQLGAAGAAMTAAIALGPAFGGVLLGLSPTAPLAAAASLNLLVAVLLTTMPPFLAARAASPSRAEVLTRSPLLVVPLALGFAERFTVGCFVVSFAVYAHESLGLGDRETSLRMSLFVMPFAAAMYPAWLLCGRIARATLMGTGAFVYGVSFLLLALTRGALLDASLVLAGISSALMYAPSIWYTSALAPDRSRATAMALFNAAGCLGMMLGPAVAGVLSATLRAHGHGAATRYPVIFAVAGGVQLVTLLALRKPLAKLRATEPAPSSALEVAR
jgi:MFS family permease